MKVCFISDNISSIGGQQRVLVTLANGLAEITGIEVSILFYSPKKKALNFQYDLNDKIKIIWTNSMSREKYKYLQSKFFLRLFKKNWQPKNIESAVSMAFSNRELKQYTKFIKQNNFDIVIGLAPHTSAILGLISSQVNAKTIGWLHSTYPRYFQSKDGLTNLDNIYSYAMKGLDKIIVLTKAASLEFKEKMKLNTLHISNPLSFNVNKTSELQLGKLIFIGRLQYSIKGLDKLIEILNELRNDSINFHINIVGDGPDRERLENDIKTNELDNFVDIVGSTKEVEDYLLKSSVLVLPSIVEGFGLVVTEAFECGVPVISFDTEGPSEIITNGKDGFLVSNYNISEFAKYIELLINNEETLNELSDNAKETAKRYSIESTVEKWLDLFNNLITK